jgi:hypothetical protein
VSGGTPSSPMLIHDNYIQGGYTIKPGQGDASDGTYSYDWGFSGGGIIVDGYHGSDQGWINILNNQVVSTTNYGVAASIGHDINMNDNRVVSSGLLPDGVTHINANNIGEYGGYNVDQSELYNVSGMRNIIGWENNVGTGRNDWGNDNWVNFPETGADANIHLNGTATITLADERAEYATWQAKLAAARVTVGPSTSAGA